MKHDNNNQTEIPTQDVTPTEQPQRINLAWKDIKPTLPSVELSDMKTHTLEFLKSEPYEFSRTKIYNNEPKEIHTKMFDVKENGEEKKVFVSNDKLLSQLKAHDPLQNKTLNVTRTGKGMNTKYQVTK